MTKVGTKPPKWDEKYDLDEYLFGTEPNQFLADSYGAIPKGEVLCLADGEGRNSVFLAQQGYRVTAVDISLVGLEKAKRLAEKNKVSVNFVHADLQEYPLGENCWDGIVSIFCHTPVSLREKIHSDVVTGLKSEGVFLLEAYTPEQLKHGTGGPQAEELLMTSASLTDELKGLHIEHLQELERYVKEGIGHDGHSAVVQLCARK